MSYVRNPDFQHGKTLTAESLKKMENAIIQNETDISDIKANGLGKPDWNAAAASSPNFISNKPLYYESKQYAWDGTPNYSLMGTNDSYKISDTPPKKEVLVDGKITVSINNTSYADIYIERVCVTTLEITDFLATSQYHGIVISGLVFGFPSTVSMVAVAGNNDIYPLVALIPESFEGIQAGFYFMKGTGLNSGSTIAYCESLQFMDVIVKDEYKHFFDQFENKIKLMEVTSLEGIRFDLFKPGDIVYAIVDMNSVMSQMGGDSSGD